MYKHSYIVILFLIGSYKSHNSSTISIHCTRVTPNITTFSFWSVKLLSEIFRMIRDGICHSMHPCLVMVMTRVDLLIARLDPHAACLLSFLQMKEALSSFFFHKMTQPKSSICPLNRKSTNDIIEILQCFKAREQIFWFWA